MYDIRIWKPGDLLICINSDPPSSMCEQQRAVVGRIQKGAYYRIERVVWLDEVRGVHLVD